MSETVGIDLGTTYSLIGGLEGESVHFYPDESGQILIPSAVAFSNGNLIVGRAAKDQIALEPNSGVTQFKRKMGIDFQYHISNRVFSSIDLSCLLLKHLRENAERATGRKVARAVITVPAYFSEEQRVATRDAARLAGLEVVRLLNEPTAAAIAYGIQKKSEAEKIMVIDLGGGTFDVCVMELFEGTLQVLSVAGVSQLGGEDFTDSLINHILKVAGLDRSHTLVADSIGLLRKRAEQAKISLSRDRMVTVKIPASGKEVSVSIEEFKKISESLIQQMRSPCRIALSSASLTSSDISEVILVGGATRMPIIRNFIEELFNQEPLSYIVPDLAVAQGAVLMAGLYDQNKIVEDLVVTDVISHSLGIEIARQFGNHITPGFFQPIIHRNTTIPVSYSDFFVPIIKGQTKLHLKIYEGESRFCTENRLLGTLTVNGLPKLLEDAQVEVRFTYDLNGILDVEAKIVSTGKIFKKLLVRGNQNLSDSELTIAQKQLDQIKRDPLDNPRIKSIFLRATLLLQDIAPMYREELGDMLDSFEQLRVERRHDALESLANSIMEFCERFDDGKIW